jgi:hypothetical protein
VAVRLASAFGHDPFLYWRCQDGVALKLIRLLGAGVDLAHQPLA